MDSIINTSELYILGYNKEYDKLLNLYNNNTNKITIYELPDFKLFKQLKEQHLLYLILYFNENDKLLRNIFTFYPDIMDWYNIPDNILYEQLQNKNLI